MNRRDGVIAALVWTGFVFLVSHGYVGAMRSWLSIHTNTNNPVIASYDNIKDQQGGQAGLQNRWNKANPSGLPQGGT